MPVARSGPVPAAPLHSNIQHIVYALSVLQTDPAGTTFDATIASAVMGKYFIITTGPLAIATSGNGIAFYVRPQSATTVRITTTNSHGSATPVTGGVVFSVVEFN